MATTYTRKPYTRKAQTPAEMLASALELAHKKGLTVAFAGADHWAVPSDSEALKGLYHIVTRSADRKRLVCQCLYSQNKPSGVCSHRAIVWEYLKHQAEAAAALVPPASTMRPVAEAAVKQAAQPLQPRTRAEAFRPAPAPQPAPKAAPAVKATKANALPYDDGRAFSIFKPERDEYIEAQKASMRTNGARPRQSEEW